MPSYLRFDTDDGVPIFLEAAVEEITDGAGPQKAGVQERLEHVVVTSRDAVERTIQMIVRCHGRMFASAISGLEKPPSEAELSFGLKATGEVGNFVITKISGEMNYGVRLMWRNPTG